MNKAIAKGKIYMGCRCYERLQPNTKEFTRLAYRKLPPSWLKLSLFFFIFFTRSQSETNDERGKRMAEEGGGGGIRRDILLCSAFSEWSPAQTAAPPVGFDVQGGVSRKGNHTGALLARQ
jgi:hypothetical protein